MTHVVRGSQCAIARIALILFILCFFLQSSYGQEDRPSNPGSSNSGTNMDQIPNTANCSTPAAVFDPACTGILSNQAPVSPLEPTRPNPTGSESPFDFTNEERQDRLTPPQPNRQPPSPSSARSPLPPEPPTDFQKFVESSVGKMLPLYGSQLFTDVPTTFAPLDQVPVTSDYVIGPGDELLLRAWGSITFNLHRTVDRNGYIYIPNVGQIQVSGLRFVDAKDFISAQIGHVFQRFQISVEMGQLRSVQIFVVGRARRPGTYTVSSLSTVVNAIFAAGGPSSSGSMRRIQLKRNSRVVAEVDLYNLLMRGDKSSDVTILPGDVIYIPPAGPRVALAGSVNEPAIYEIKSGETLGTILDMEGGVTSLATEQAATLQRFELQDGPRVVDLRLDSTGLETRLRDGDILWVRSIVPQYRDTVTLRGNVANPGRYAWHPGMRIRDLIPNKDILLTRNFWQQHNKLGLPFSKPPLTSSGNTPSEDPNSQQLDASQGPRSGRPQAQRGDMPSAQDNFGSQQQPQPPQQQDDSSIQNFASLAPSSTYYDQNSNPRAKTPASVLSARSSVGTQVPAIDWDYAVIERLDKNNLTTTLIPFHLGRLILEGDDSENLELRPGDILTIFSHADVLVPQERQRKLVRLEGEFQASGVYSARPGETLRQLVVRAGGLTPQAYLYGSSFARESTRIQQQARLDDYITRLDEEIQRATANKSGSVITPAEAAVTTATLEGQRGLIAKLRQLRATGRIVLGLGPQSGSVEDIPDIPLEDGDVFLVPAVPSNISVIGAVYDQNSFLYKSSSDTNDYLDLAGGFTRNADDSHMFIIRADGSVYSHASHTHHHGSVESARLNPGDAIVVPEKINKSTLLRGLTDWSSVFSQFALGAAAVNVIR
jgi:polysaccharide biosynthesis/export protein